VKDQSCDCVNLTFNSSRKEIKKVLACVRQDIIEQGGRLISVVLCKLNFCVDLNKASVLGGLAWSTNIVFWSLAIAAAA
jgi:hypothetical protein